jgi:hypothetical protein
MKLFGANKKIRAYEVREELPLLTRRGDFIRCKVIRARAFAYPGHPEAAIAIIVRDGDPFRYVNYRFDEWFADWTEADNMRRTDPRAGRAIDIAVPIRAYTKLMAGGRLYYDYALEDDEWSGLYARWNNPTVAAVKIDGAWVEPSPARVTRLLIEPRPL